MKNLILPTLAGLALCVFSACSHTTVNPPPQQPTVEVAPAPSQPAPQTTTSQTTTTTTQPTQ